MIAIKASEVMGAVVDEERMTCRKGWRIEGVSTVRMSVESRCQLYCYVHGAREVAWHTSASLELTTQTRKGRQQRIVLNALPFLAPKTPSCSQLSTVAIVTHSERGQRRRWASSSTAAEDC